jgi:hypothetical protein
MSNPGERPKNLRKKIMGRGTTDLRKSMIDP